MFFVALIVSLILFALLYKESVGDTTEEASDDTTKNTSSQTPALVKICWWLVATLLVASVSVSTTTRTNQIRDIEAVAGINDLELAWADKVVAIDPAIAQQLAELQSLVSQTTSPEVALAQTELVSDLLRMRLALHLEPHNYREERARLQQQIRTRARSPWALPFTVPSR